MNRPLKSLFSFIVGIAILTTAASAQTTQKAPLNREGAKRVVAAAGAEAQKRNTTAVIAFVDDGGNLIASERLLLVAVARAGESTKQYVNVDRHGLALQGYDPVGYFKQNKAVQGDAKITSTYHGATYRFSSEESKTTFDKEPAKYEPQYGGFCGYAVSKGYTASIDPDAFLIHDGRLILQNSKSVLKKWNKDPASYLKNADSNWPRILDKNGK